MSKRAPWTAFGRRDGSLECMTPYIAEHIWLIWSAETLSFASKNIMGMSFETFLKINSKWPESEPEVSSSNSTRVSMEAHRLVNDLSSVRQKGTLNASKNVASLCVFSSRFSLTISAAIRNPCSRSSWGGLTTTAVRKTALFFFRVRDFPAAISAPAKKTSKSQLWLALRTGWPIDPILQGTHHLLMRRVGFRVGVTSWSRSLLHCIEAWAVFSQCQPWQPNAVGIKVSCVTVTGLDMFEFLLMVPLTQ